MKTFSRKMLERSVAVLDALPPPPADAELIEQADLLEKALFVAAHFDRVEHIQPLVARFKKLLQLPVGPLALKAVLKTANKGLPRVAEARDAQEIDDLLTWMGEVILGGRDLTMLTAQELADAPEKLQVLLELAAGWYYFGRDQQAEPVLNAAHAAVQESALVQGANGAGPRLHRRAGPKSRPDSPGAVGGFVYASARRARCVDNSPVLQPLSIGDDRNGDPGGHA